MGRSIRAADGTVGALEVKHQYGNDKIWYDESENPLVPCPDVLMDPDSTAGGGTGDECGDANDFNQGDLPDNCEDRTITVTPTRCEGQN